MSNEATIQSGLTLRVGNLEYQSKPATIRADVGSNGPAGPTPGYVLATLTGALIDLTKLINLGGLVWVQNTDPTNFIEICVYDPDSTKFYSFMELLPGEAFAWRMSRNYQNEFGAGTGTTGSNVQFYARVDPTQPLGTTAWLRFDAFNK